MRFPTVACACLCRSGWSYLKLWETHLASAAAWLADTHGGIQQEFNWVCVEQKMGEKRTVLKKMSFSWCCCLPTPPLLCFIGRKRCWNCHPNRRRRNRRSSDRFHRSPNRVVGTGGSLFPPWNPTAKTGQCPPVARQQPKQHYIKSISHTSVIDFRLYVTIIKRLLQLKSIIKPHSYFLKTCNLKRYRRSRILAEVVTLDSYANCKFLNSCQ